MFCCRKLGMTAVALAAGLFLLSFTRVGSYVGTIWSKVSTTAQNSVPIELEIERLKHEIAQLTPDMKKHLSDIAQEKVVVDNLREDVANLDTRLQTQQKKLLALTEAIEQGSERVSLDDRVYERDRLIEKRSRDWTSFKRGKDELAAKKKLLDVKERALETALDQVASIKDQKQNLEIQVEQLEAQLKTVRLDQTNSKFQFDDSRLADIKASVANIKDRLKAESYELELKESFANDEIPSEKKAKSVEDESREIRQYFGNTKKGARLASDNNN